MTTATRTPAQSRSLLLNIADQLDQELTFQEMVSFLPAATVEEFLSHLKHVVDIEDLLPRYEA